MKTLMIVESPHKAKEISKFLGADFNVLASYGHVRDLPASGEKDGELVVGIGRDFQPRYEAGDRSRPTIAKLREAAKAADRVVLATDPDREGEAIAWHLQDVLGLRNPQRVTYQEISSRAVKAALEKPRAINLNLVRAQEARRIIDRLVGYAVSPLLSRQAGQPLSAGRVQSVALRLVVEREREIQRFAQRMHYGVEVTLEGGWTATWDVTPHLPAGEKLFTDANAAQRVAGARKFVVADFADTTASEAPPAPFITSSLQQEGGKSLGLKVKAVMAAAQALFDKGHITYHRTDNPNFLEEGHGLIQAYATAAGIPLAAQQRKWKAKDGAQEGHEAIRPVDLAVEDAGDDDAQRALYRLIRARALASQMPDAQYAVRTVKLDGDTGPDGLAELNGTPVTFIARGRRLTERGWRALYAGDAKDEGEEAAEADAQLSNPVPVLTTGARVQAISGRRIDKKTKPRQRFTEAGLVKELEARGIGRPSTYASIISNISDRSYVVPGGPKDKYLVPTSTGEAIVDALTGKCQFAEYEYTAGIENTLDLVANGDVAFEAAIAPAWRQLESELDGLRVNVSVTPEHPCPDCGKALRRRNGAKGFFWGCTGYPACNTTLPDARGKPGKRAEVSAEHKCIAPGCGKPLVHRVKKGKSGFDFWGCTGFPGCKASYKTGADGKPILGSK
ncbi:type I DNA topoisomerase [Xanthomonas campestris pv. campestris]|nr:type I DNA topoisomerase [Xanthomonas campestris pv. campestris]MEB1789610.1 type I DNA topoisomerase [Xanthomonas campestris pv. campestris]MEB1844491.1 type I DNA topoisomerase [Xanthomonas campestris pv. campestris]MEB1878252.1 type I DNA topoisomerase [Xanthomonas campestris pv. campestris]